MKNFLKKILIWALRAEARAVVAKYKPQIVAITGSVGKTSAKDAIYSVLEAREHVRKSEKSFNSEFGLPLTILGVPNAWNNPFRWGQNLIDGLLLLAFTHRYPKWLVLEVGADRPGDIKSVSKWLPVTVAVITRLPEVMAHVEFFDSQDKVAEEKASLIDALVPQGTLVLYSDDARAPMLKARAGDKKIITFGFLPEADVRAEDLAILFEEGKEHSASSQTSSRDGFPIGMSARISIEGTSVPVEVVGTVGAHSFLPALAAAGVGQALGKNKTDIVEALRGYEPPPGRMHLVRGIKETMIIDDTYNSSPAAAVAALETLDLVGRAAPERGISPARRIAVLGDMLELGRHSVEEHRKIGAKVAETSDMLVTVGFRARDIAQGALAAGMEEKNILQFEDAEKAGEELATLIQPGDAILVKGSQSMRMERAVLELMANPERAKDILVRQDVEWKKR
ncbi:MAG: UDP-N-acetylmuramoyl-tripeptide--D-alanyl-D-alanine ligase [bacterium]|nr:UDP-N-acetylmuramoyl-tripeptide--D-alanyl-D-alanine ligase [bacterium]